jgi:ribose-phosphate pyrophosphokinase
VESGTTELVLPGLHAPAEAVAPARGHWLERGPQKRLMLCAGRSHSELAHKIAEKLDVELGEITLKTFANGETYCRFEESIRGTDLFLIQTGCDPVDRNLMELFIMIQAAKLASAKRITAVIPWFPYSRQDKKSAPREPITGKLVADFLQVAGVDRVLTMDLHAGQIQGFFGIPVDHMTALPLFAQHFRDQGLSGDGVVSVAPDAGRAKMGVKFSQMLEGDFAIMHKTRPGHDQAAVTEVTGNVRGKVAIVGDDVIMTGGTIISGARALRAAGATAVYVFATHGIFAGGALERFAGAGDLNGVVVTDTVPIDPRRRPGNLTVLSVAGLLADTIWNVFSDESVSAIFAGENQLF